MSQEISPILEGERRSQMIEHHGQDYVCKHYPRGCNGFEPCVKEKYNIGIEGSWLTPNPKPHLFTNGAWEWCFYGECGRWHGPFEDKCSAVAAFNEYMERLK